MDNANMPPGSDNSNDSDDLIAELARLMAAEAKGEPEAEATPAAPEPLATPAPAPLAAQEPKSDPIPRLSPQPEPEQERPAPAFVRPPSADEPVAEPKFADPIPPSMRNSQAPASATIAHPAGTAHEPQIAEQAAPFGLQPPAEQTPASDRFSFDPAPTPPAADVEQPHTQTSDVGTPTPDQLTEPDDPIGALISAQLESIAPEEFTEAPMEKPPAPPAQPTSNDSFGVAPVFGLGGNNSERFKDSGKRDPLDDIESLIGAALKTDQQTEPAAEPNPAQSALPQVEPAPEEQIAGAANAAEAAILAATQSMRPQDNYVAPEQPLSHPTPDAHVDPAIGVQTGSRPSTSGTRKSGGSQKIAGPAVAAALLIAVGLGLYWVFGTGGGEEGDAPVLSADATPAKQAPAATTSEPNSAGSVVLSDDAGQAETTIERLISRDDSTDVAGNEVSRVITQSDTEELGLANRKVRTVTVRPDGTIVSGDDAVAGGQQLPVDRPNVPQLSPADTPTAVAANQTTTVPQTTQVESAPALSSGVVPPIPRPRPTNRASAPTIAVSAPLSTPTATSSNTNAVNLIANTANQAVSSNQTTIAQPVATAPALTGTKAPAYVQLSSQRSPEAANQSLASVRSQFGAQLNGGTLEIQEVNLGERGVFYRVRLPAQSLEAANNVCANIKTAGGDCFVRTD